MTQKKKTEDKKKHKQRGGDCGLVRSSVSFRKEEKRIPRVVTRKKKKILNEKLELDKPVPFVPLIFNYDLATKER